MFECDSVHSVNLCSYVHIDEVMAVCVSHFLLIRSRFSKQTQLSVRLSMCCCFTTGFLIMHGYFLKNQTREVIN